MEFCQAEKVGTLGEIITYIDLYCPYVTSYALMCVIFENIFCRT